jgi:hypothetical protein
MYLLDGTSGRHHDCYLVSATGQIFGTEASPRSCFRAMANSIVRLQPGSGARAPPPRGHQIWWF